MSARLTLGIGATAAFVAAVIVVLLTFERPPVLTVQRGYRGTAMELVYNPRGLDLQAVLNAVPAAPDAADDDGPRASEVFENVQVLGNLSVAQFGRVMQVMTEWVVPAEIRAAGNGCNYCHNPENLAEDNPYTKVVSRRMLQMTQQINAQHANHVGQTGVTCYTCHRGNPVPTANWSTAVADLGRLGGLVAGPSGQNRPATAANLSSLPLDPYTPFLLNNEPIRVVGRTPLPSGNDRSIKQAEWTYALMTHFSEALGVGCVACHNSRQFSSWEESTPQRMTAWHGINMMRDINLNYIEPLRSEFPAHRLGPGGDPLKANCTTCHQGAYRPLYGAPMLRDYRNWPA